MRLHILYVIGVTLFLSNSAVADPESAPEFVALQDYLNLDMFCMDQGFEGKYAYFAIGYKQILPWATTVLCLGETGIHEVATTNNGSHIEYSQPIKHHTALPPVWVNRPSMLVEISEAELLKCPVTEEWPIGILPEWGAVSGLYAEISYGSQICVEDADIVVYSPEGREQHRFDGYTPYIGGPFSSPR